MVVFLFCFTWRVVFHMIIYHKTISSYLCDLYHQQLFIIAYSLGKEFVKFLNRWNNLDVVAQIS